MRDWPRLLALILLALCVLSVAPAAPVWAQSREFSGKIDKIGKRRMVVDSGMGEKVRFRRTNATAVSDQRPPRLRASPRKAWEDLRAGDWVAVEWQLADKPRKAYRIVVLPPRKGAREEDRER